MFAFVALFRVYTDPPAGAMLPTLEWLNPFAIVGEDGASIPAPSRPAW